MALKQLRFAITIAALFVGSASAAPPSATKARDVNGVALGMSLNSLKQIMALNAIGGDQYDGSKDGTTYNVEVTPLGRVFRIASSQPLGNFRIDRSFLISLASKLTTKYGPTFSASGENYEWALIEQIQEPDGFRRNFKTNWMTALVDGGPDNDERSLNIAMIDFRILWADQTKLNLAPRWQAENSIKF